MNPERRKYPEEIQEMRDSLADKVKEIRSDRDEKNEQANTLLAKTKDVLGMKEGSSDLRYEAKQLSAEATETLRIGKNRIEREKESGVRGKVLDPLLDIGTYGFEASAKYFSNPEVSEWIRFALSSKIASKDVVFRLGGYFSSLAADTPQAERVNEVLSNICLENIDSLKVGLSTIGFNRRYSFELLGGILRVSKNQELRKICAEELMQRLPEVFGEMVIGYRSSFYTVEAMVEEKQGEVANRFESFLIRRFVEEKDYATIARVIESARQPNIRNIAIKVVEAQVQKIYGITINVVEDWLEGENKNVYPNIINNLSVMEKVEEADTGAVKLLNEQFGIVEFQRYPVEVLSKQVREVDQDLPYGIVIFPHADHNGAFDNDDQILADISKKLEGKYSLRIFECGSRSDIARVLLGSNKKYGQKNKIEFAILGGHGSAYGIELGKESQWHLSREDIQGPGTAKAASFFNENPTIILFSCSTGKPGGFAQILSEVGKAKVIAPKEPTSPKSVEVSLGADNRPVFSVRYRDPEIGRQYNMGKPTDRPKPRIGLF